MSFSNSTIIYPSSVQYIDHNHTTPHRGLHGGREAPLHVEANKPGRDWGDTGRQRVLCDSRATDKAIMARHRGCLPLLLFCLTGASLAFLSAVSVPPAAVPTARGSDGPRTGRRQHDADYARRATRRVGGPLAPPPRTSLSSHAFDSYDRPVVLIGLSSSPESDELGRLASSLSRSLAGDSEARVGAARDAVGRSVGAALLGDGDDDGVALSAVGVDDEYGPCEYLRVCVSASSSALTR